MAHTTDEFSFVLKPSSIEGVGVFAAKKIKKGSRLRLFNNEPPRFISRTSEKAKQNKDFLKRYCVEGVDGYSCPTDFGSMEVGWFLNHSKSPNAFHKNYHYYAQRDIKKDEEITISYETLDDAHDNLS